MIIMTIKSKLGKNIGNNKQTNKPNEKKTENSATFEKKTNQNIKEKTKQ